MKTRVLSVCLLVLPVSLSTASAVEKGQEAKTTPITVTVTGSVGKPGIVSLDEHRSLADALARVGGFTRFAATRDVVVTSKTGEKKIYDVDEILKKGDRGPELRDGDVIFVPER
jgi:protein involved in polysaccharide export with SLBB domain